MNPGTRIGPYEIVAWLGAGGMGEVYRARDARLGRDVAIKVIAATLAADSSRVHRFEQEARAAGQINHPNILAVHDAGIHDGAPYIVSELLEGESLRTRLQAGAVPPRKAIDYARQAAEGLAAAHAKGIVHRDVKPDNLFITKDGRIKILDFGIAKLTTAGDDRTRHTGFPTDTAAGTVVGTVGYMSPEQVRGEDVDARSDIFSVGTVLYEMLTGRPPFTRGTAADTMAAILKEEPAEPLPADVPPALARIIARCLEKTREARFQSARDLAFGLDVLSGTHANAAPSATGSAPRRWPTALGVAVVVVSLLAALASWLTRAAPPADNPLATATISRFTSWPGTESGAEISPDGRFVAFIADRDGEFDLFVSQVGTGIFVNLTRDMPPLHPTGVVLRSFGFSGDGSEIWLSTSGDPGGRKVRLPIFGGPTRAFLGEGDSTPAWSPDGAHLAYFNHQDGDPLYVAGPSGGDPRLIFKDDKGGIHNHNPAWSADGEWIYFVHGPEATADMDIWRVRPSERAVSFLTALVDRWRAREPGGRERLTHRHIPVNFLAPIDPRTVLYVSLAEDGSGPWLWALDVPSQVTRRVSSGLEQYTYVSASRDGKRVVATVANRTSSLWQVPIGDRPAEDRDVAPYPVTAERALAPRFAGTTLFYLSASGPGDGLWKVEDGKVSLVWNGVDGALSEPPAVSPDGKRVAVVVRQGGKRRLMIMSADGTNPRTLAPSIEIQGAAGQAAADWSPDGKWIVTVGDDEGHGPALLKIPVDGGQPVALRPGQAGNPIWSPDDKLILFAGPFVAGSADLLGVRPDGTRVELPPVRVRPGGYRFLPGGKRVVYLPTRDALGFWQLDLATGRSHRLTALGNHGALSTFDISPNGRIVFDRSQDNSDIFLIERPK
jgi:serine/threonine protein kinase